MSGIHKIETPRGFIEERALKNGSVTTRLVWNPGFGPKMSDKANQAQAFVDSEVLRKSSPYVPLRTGTLMRSGQLGTEIGSGEVRWIAPYARTQYYETATSRSYAPLRGAFWFERMKNASGGEILDGAAKILGGRATRGGGS